MDDYRVLYHMLFIRVTEAIETLAAAQRQTEELLEAIRRPAEPTPEEAPAEEPPL